MNDKPDNAPDPQWLRDLPIRSEEIGFSEDKLVACPTCEKRNAPNKAACLYCGTSLDTDDSKSSLEFRELEGWENGFNLVARGPVADPDAAAQAVASLLKRDREQLADLFRVSSSLPIARVATADEAASITEELLRRGIQLMTISDQDLVRKSAPVRLRSIRFDGAELVLMPFAAGDPVSLQSDDLVLVVAGMTLRERVESTERKKRKTTTTVSESKLSSDDAFFDIYSKTDPTGWRIPVTGFDFSFLESEKSLLAGDNMKKLLARLRSFSPAMKVVDDYARVRSMLEYCWPSDQRKDTRNPKLFGYGSKDKTSIFTTDNSTQVTKYSRLQWHLL